MRIVGIDSCGQLAVMDKVAWKKFNVDKPISLSVILDFCKMTSDTYGYCQSYEFVDGVVTFYSEFQIFEEDKFMLFLLGHNVCN